MYGVAPAHARRPLVRAPTLAPVQLNGLLHQHHHHHHHHQAFCHHGCSATLTMADPAAFLATAADDDMAQLQKLSGEYEAEALGPLVSQRQSSAAITAQYVDADPVYRVKTAALPGQYAYFRTCRGDGHCGWRAIAFTYFEALLRVADADKLTDEEARLNSLGNLLDAIGYARDIWLDFAEEAWHLLRRLAASLRAADGAAADVLLHAFNDVSTSMAIITYVKLLASAWVQTHPDDFRHFVPMGDVKAYCAHNIDPAQCEADNIGIAALAEALVKPAGFGLEVWYLDRSPGEEINLSFCAKPTDCSSASLSAPPTLRLLYRPGHYDILYKAEDVSLPDQHQPMSPLQTPQVAMVSCTDDFMPTASNVVDIIHMLPNIYPTDLGQRWSSLSYNFAPSSTTCAQPTPVQPYLSIPTPLSPASTSHLDFASPVQYDGLCHPSIHLDQSPVTLPIHPSSAPSVGLETSLSSASSEKGGPFRPSMYELEPGFGSSMQVQPLQTAIFRNSHFNTAHFMNPDFQPEEWCPGGDYVTGNKRCHRS